MHLSEKLHLLAWDLFFLGTRPFFVTASEPDENFNKIKVTRDMDNGPNNEQIKKCLSNGSACVSICCQPGWYYENSKCIYNDTAPVSELQYPQIHSDDWKPLNRTVSEFTHVHHTSCTYGNTFLNPEITEEMYYFMENGSLYLPNCYDGKMYTIEEYCLASTLEVNSSMTMVMVCTEKKREDETLYLLYPVTLIISVPFFIATIIVYTVIPALNNLHGLCLRIQMTMLTLTYALLAVLQLINIEQLKKTVLCKIIAAIDYFLYLGNFFWLNVLCIDIWWTFGGFRKLQVREKQQDGRLFLIYSMYAWGSICLLTAMCIAMDYIPTTVMSIVPRPEFGAESCWFRTRQATNLYFYGPMGLTVTCNICLFIMIAVKLLQHERTTARQLKSKDSQRHDENKQQFHVCLKLLVLMGLNWSMEIISWACDNEPATLWTVIDMGNTLQGVILFLLLVCNARIKKLLLKRLGWQNFSSLKFSCTDVFVVSEGTNKTSLPGESYHSNPAFEGGD